MPTPATTKWPRPNSEDEWEDMVLDALRIHWNDINACRYGRNGQKQNGIDIIGTRDSYIVAAQAKNSDTLTEKTIEKEIESAKDLHIELKEFYFVISGSRDTKLQQLIHQISEKNKTNKSFSIFILFFEDVCSCLSKDPSLITKYWKSFITEISQKFKNPILSTNEAFDTIYNLYEYKVLEEIIRTTSSGKVGLCFRIESSPQLDAEIGSEARRWEIAIAENHETHIVTLWRFAIDIDSGMIYYFSIVDAEWLSPDQWRGEELF